ncbi:MAG: alpha/beta fold hydrolase [Myxococcales bacterium]
MPRKRLRMLLGLLGWLALSGCNYLRVTREPMEKTIFVGRGPDKARGAIVLLPGFGDRPETFQEQGFVRGLVQVAPDYDVVGADAHFGYYRNRNLLARLQKDVIGPLVAQGYRELWLIGASMGGHGAVAYARAHPEKIAGVMLFAPYMGPGEVVDEVKRAGGLCQYQVPPYQDTREGFARANFGWLKQAACSSGSPQIWLAVGDQDGLLAADRVLADVLPRERVLILPGKHGWKVWTPAVRQLAARAFDK